MNHPFRALVYCFLSGMIYCRKRIIKIIHVFVNLRKREAPVNLNGPTFVQED